MTELRRRRKQAGLVPVLVYVPEECADDFRKRASEMAGAHASGDQSRLTEENSTWLTGRDDVEPRAARALAERITREINALGWPVGRVIADEAELLNRYGVARGTLREAIRLLEHHNIAKMKRGGGGGLAVDRPSPASIVYGARIYLEFRKISLSSFLPVLITLEKMVIDKVIDGLNDIKCRKLKDFIEEEGSAVYTDQKDYQRFDMLLADLSDDPALILFMHVLLDLTLGVTSSKTFSTPDIPGKGDMIKIYHRNIALFILSRDRTDAKNELVMLFDFVENIISSAPLAES